MTNAQNPTDVQIDTAEADDYPTGMLASPTRTQL
jgi:hypothetical protein